MTTKFIQPGKVLDYTNGTGSAIAVNSAVLIGTKVGVALSNIPVGGTGSVQICGVFQLPKVSGDTPAQGALVYLVSASGAVTTTASGNTLAGVAAVAGVSGQTALNVLLNGTPA